MYAHRIVPALAAALLVLATSGAAEAKPSKGACGLDFLPLAEGNEWTYTFFIPDGLEPAPGLHVVWPDTMTVKVVGIERKGETTLVTVEESYRDVKSTAVLECTKNHLDVPPSSFFFAGQPGGGLGMEVAFKKHEGHSFLTKKGLKEDSYEEFVGTATRKASEGSGAELPVAHLEVERKMSVLGRQEAESDLGMHRATRVDVRMTGRAALDSQKGKPFNMPEVQTAMWYAPGVGLVRLESSTARGWRLTSFKQAE